MKRKIAFSTKCRTKKKFYSEDKANKRSEQIFKESGNKLYVYKCNVCSQYHLTRKDEKERQKIEKLAKKYQKMHNKDYKRQIQRESDYWKQRLGIKDEF